MFDPTHDGAPIHDRGPAQQVSHGHWVYPLDIRPEDIFIEDIAASLSKINRFLGHTIIPYSVAEHSIMVSQIVPPEYALIGLLHDASEAYIGDITRPVKKCMDRIAPSRLSKLATAIDVAISYKFGLPWPWPECVKEADTIALFTEKRDLLAPSNLDWGPGPTPLTLRIVPCGWEAAHERFLDRFSYLSTRAPRLIDNTPVSHHSFTE